MEDKKDEISSNKKADGHNIFKTALTAFILWLWVVLLESGCLGILSEFYHHKEWLDYFLILVGGAIAWGIVHVLSMYIKKKNLFEGKKDYALQRLSDWCGKHSFMVTLGLLMYLILWNALLRRGRLGYISHLLSMTHGYWLKTGIRIWPMLGSYALLLGIAYMISKHIKRH